jgi:hypothetical protein
MHCSLTLALLPEIAGPFLIGWSYFTDFLAEHEISCCVFAGVALLAKLNRSSWPPLGRFECFRHPLQESIFTAAIVTMAFSLSIQPLQWNDLKRSSRNIREVEDRLDQLSEGSHDPRQLRTDLNQITGLASRMVTENFDIRYPQATVDKFEIVLARNDGVLMDVMNAPTPNKDFDVFPRNSFVGKSIALSEFLYCPDLDRRQKPPCEFFIDPKPRRSAFASILCVPIDYNGRVVGALCLENFRADAFDAVVDDFRVRFAEELQLLGRLLSKLQASYDKAKRANDASNHPFPAVEDRSHFGYKKKAWNFWLGFSGAKALSFF